MTTENEELSMRDEMEAAVQQFEGSDESTIEDEYVEETPEIQTSEAETATNGDITPDHQSAAPAETTEQTEPTDNVKAPTSWNPKLREEFGKLPPHIQQQISKRETEINKFQNDGAEARKIGDKFSQVAQSYQSVMSAHGTNDPVEAFKGLMDTAALLQGGNPQQKAEKLAAMVQHYGIDIGMLDSALSGQPIANPENQQIEQMLEQKLAPYQQFMSSVQQQQQQQQMQTQQSATQEINEFEAKAEFLGDVRNDMADLLDMAAQRGVNMSLQEAYDKACAFNPEISQVLKEREHNQQILGANQTAQSKRAAASSINGRQTTTQAPQGDDSIHSLLNQAWDDQNR